MNNKKAFSFVELIVVISIIALISVIWLSINSGYTERSKNSKITSDIQTLKNSLESYKSDTKTLPDPKWNQKFFDDSSNYVHYDDSTAFWVAGFITEDTIPKKYLWYLPIDPRTEQYYAYGKTLTWWLYFEIAGVNITNGTYESKVVWDYTGESGPYNLIREYNWPDFVYDRSTKNFPYNPDERIIKWKIWSIRGLVTVNGVIINDTWIANNELKAWDTIEVAMWWEAQIYYSDWSKSYLGDPAKASKLILANMVYKDENNLFTKIQLALDYGTIWTKTSKLDPKSEFEIYTTDTEAAVRGTIFGVSNNWTLWSTKISVQTWSVEITKIANTDSTINTIIDKLNSDDNIATTNFYVSPSVSNITIDPTNLKVSMFATWQTVETYTTSSIFPNPILNPILPNLDWLTNTQPKIQSIIPWWTLVLELPSSFSWAGLKIISWTTPIPSWSWTWSANLLTITWLIGTQEIKICDPILLDNCTKSVSVPTTLGYSSTCELWEIDFWNVWCVEQDTSLVASWYTLVAYAPYDKLWDLNMYKAWWDIINYSTAGIDSLDDNNLESFPNWCEKTKSFCDIDWVKWVFIWTWTTIADYIKYTGLDSLNLWPNFAIEMSVRGEALKRVSVANYYLFNSDTYRLFMKNSLWYEMFSIIQAPLTTPFLPFLNNFSVSNLNNNSFYKTIFKKDWTNWTLSLNWYSTWSTSLSWTLSLWNILNIWNFNSSPSSLQWNDIIDYVKIYKKP